MRENNVDNIEKTPRKEVRRNHKRSRSIDSGDSNSRKKLQKIDEEAERGEDQNENDSEDILSFAKKTLQHTELPDTEDFLNNLPKADTG